MSLTSQQRYGAFFIGVGIGCVLVTIYFGVRGVPQPPELPPPGVIRREVPGAVLQWMTENKPIEGPFVLSQADARKAGGVSSGRFSRFLVVPGLDPGAYIRIQETATLQEPDKIIDWKFMFADQVRAQFQPNADTKAMAAEMSKLGWHFSGGKDKDGWVTIILKDHQATSVDQALGQLQQWPQWIAKAEPDYLPVPSMPGNKNQLRG